MSRSLHRRLAIAALLVLGASTAAEQCRAQQLPPRQIIPLMNNGSLSVNQNPKAQILAQLNQPVINFIAAANQDIRLMQAGVPIDVDRMIVALQPGTQITISVPAGSILVAGPAPTIAQYILSGWGANRSYQNSMMSQWQAQQAAMANRPWAYGNANLNYNPFPTYTGFFPQQSYSSTTTHGDLYALYNLANAYNVQQSQMAPYFGGFSNTSMSGSTSAASSEATSNPFAGFDKEKKAEEPSSEKNEK